MNRAFLASIQCLLLSLLIFLLHGSDPWMLIMDFSVLPLPSCYLWHRSHLHRLVENFISMKQNEEAMIIIKVLDCSLNHHLYLMGDQSQDLGQEHPADPSQLHMSPSLGPFIILIDFSAPKRVPLPPQSTIFQESKKPPGRAVESRLST